MSIELSAKLTAWWTVLVNKARDERGLSDMAAGLIILAAVVVIAGVVAAFMTGFVNDLMAKIHT